jgi:hypothetical protein
MDLKGAFGLLRVKEADVCKLAFELTEDLSVLHLCCFFGWAATPAVFQVFSRILQRLVNNKIHGQVSVYVDDFCACSPLRSAELDRNVTRDIT